MTLKLYSVTCRGGGPYYVVTTNPTRAYEMIQNYLRENDFGDERDRRLKSIEVLADAETERPTNPMFKSLFQANLHIDLEEIPK